MKFFYFIAHENHHFSLAYKNFSDYAFHIRHCNIMLPLRSIRKGAYRYSFNTGHSMGATGCNHKGFGVGGETGKPCSFETTFRDALIETYL